MKQIIKWFKTVFSTSNYEHDLEAYILSKHPTNVAEIEYWARQYNNCSQGCC